MLLSQRPDPKEKQVINLDQDVHVCEYLGGWCMNSFHEPSLSFIPFSLDMGYLSLSLSLFEYLDLQVSNSFFSFEYLDLHVSNFFFIMLSWACLFFLKKNSPCIFSWNDNLERVVMNIMEFYFVGWYGTMGEMFLRNFQCRSWQICVEWTWSWS